MVLDFFLFCFAKHDAVLCEAAKNAFVCKVKKKIIIIMMIKWQQQQCQCVIVDYLSADRLMSHSHIQRSAAVVSECIVHYILPLSQFYNKGRCSEGSGDRITHSLTHDTTPNEWGMPNTSRVPERVRLRIFRKFDIYI